MTTNIRQKIDSEILNICTSNNFIILQEKTMKTEIYDTWSKRVCYIDKKDFEEAVKKWQFKVEKEFPNWRYKECSDNLTCILMEEDDWKLEMKEWSFLNNQYKYQIHSTIWRFPTEIIAKFKRMNVWYKWSIVRYDQILDEWIWMEESNCSPYIYVNEQNWSWRTKLENAWFKINFIS